MNQAIIIYDGNCTFCSAFIRQVIKHDGGYFKIARQQGCIYRRCVEKGLIDAHMAKHRETVYLLCGTHLYSYTDAVIRILRQCGKSGRLLAALLALFPKPMRNAGYAVIAANRNRIGGKNVCPVPSPQLLSRMI